MPRALDGPRHSRRGGPDREHMRIRRALMRLFLDLAERDGLRDSEIAIACRTSRQRASDLLHGRIARFNSETLIDILWRYGVTVDVIVSERRTYLRYKFRHPRPGWKPPPDHAYV